MAISACDTVPVAGGVASALRMPSSSSAPVAMAANDTISVSVGLSSSGTMRTPSRRNACWANGADADGHAINTLFDIGAVVEPAALLAVTVQVAFCPMSAG